MIAAGRHPVTTTTNPFEYDPGVVVVLDESKLGLSRDVVLDAVNRLVENGGAINSEEIIRNIVDGTTNEPSSELESLREEVDELRRETLCKICLEKPACILFLPCGHLSSCFDCFLPLKQCHICRNDIKGWVRANLNLYFL